jgi:hypothetical protein
LSIAPLAEVRVDVREVVELVLVLPLLRRARDRDLDLGRAELRIELGGLPVVLDGAREVEDALAELAAAKVPAASVGGLAFTNWS